MIPIRILVGDNEELIRTCAELELAKLGKSVVVDTATDHEEAIALVRERFYDIAFVDLMFDSNDENPYGKLVLAELSRVSAGCVQVLMTRHARTQGTTIVGALTANEVVPIMILKGDTEYFADTVKRVFADRLAQNWILPDIAELAGQVQSKSRRIAGLKDGTIEHEILRVLFGIFDEPASISLLNGGARVTLLPLNPGQSESSVSQAQLSYGIDPRGQEILGIRCFLKVGPRSKILEEVRRFNGLVRMGVPSEFRVEMIGWAGADALAGVCYSFAGAGSDQDIRSFDDLVRNDDTGRAISIVHRLFDPDKKSWDGVVGNPAKLRSYYESLHDHTDLAVCTGKMAAYVDKHLSGKINDRDQYVITGSSPVQIPSEADLGRGLFTRNRSTCLVHGDLHGGNLLIGPHDSVSMIDYATVGIGPRFADAAALGASVRLQQKYGTNLNDDQLFDDLLNAERALLRRDPQASAAYATNPWFPIAQEIAEAALVNVVGRGGDVTEGLLQELAVTQWAYAVNSFGLYRWSKQQRLHLIAWCAALASKWM